MDDEEGAKTSEVEDGNGFGSSAGIGRLRLLSAAPGQRAVLPSGATAATPARSYGTPLGTNPNAIILILGRACGVRERCLVSYDRQ